MAVSRHATSRGVGYGAITTAGETLSVADDMVQMPTLCEPDVAVEVELFQLKATLFFVQVPSGVAIDNVSTVTTVCEVARTTIG